MWSFILHFLVVTVSAQRPNVTVALDGTGDYRSIVEAVGVIPNNSDSLFYVYIKAGIYKENVYIGSEKRNIVMSGDGIGKTVIESSLSNSSGSGIGVSAALNIESRLFLAKDVSIVNSAGPEGGQAVALRTFGDYIACLRCSIEGFQDTLYAHRGKSQFFFNCDIYGTIDFIFGNAAVIIQNSTIHVRRPLHGQQNVITADGRDRYDSNTAIVIHNCSIVPTPDLRSQSDVKTYLGRPWNKFSQTVIMQSQLDAFIDREGWTKFDESSDVTTLNYIEFWNSGPGSSTGGRVKWPGYHVLNNPKDVQDFTVQKFINGSEWLPKFGVPYSPGLVST
ncbi:hypothetical protein Ddye_019378 [Dipteronia dyeriana]|uniref:Pectinesterase n=1 Tax=Dipteronia dyeriana TaxID=168575 RepID=A0AAD9TYM2_9ROSI|nr:hypothetical protein Ddye_019378 [Dipteronia dyeriana]